MNNLVYTIVTLSIFIAMLLGTVTLVTSCNSYIDNFNNDTKIESFNTGNTFRCYENVLDRKRRLGRKSDGWGIYKDTCKKYGLLLPMDKCKEETEF